MSEAVSFSEGNRFLTDTDFMDVDDVDVNIDSTMTGGFRSPSSLIYIFRAR